MVEKEWDVKQKHSMRETVRKQAREETACGKDESKTLGLYEDGKKLKNNLTHCSILGCLAERTSSLEPPQSTPLHDMFHLTLMGTLVACENKGSHWQKAI